MNWVFVGEDFRNVVIVTGRAGFSGGALSSCFCVQPQRPNPQKEPIVKTMAPKSGFVGSIYRQPEWLSSRLAEK
ncbi:hypothetical protein [Rosistilla oblonga]|uniref:hypothetical protein n=1 Tax=Rosistilla oblonga TaxID=2527990 RepID=UPI003A98136D